MEKLKNVILDGARHTKIFPDTFPQTKATKLTDEQLAQYHLDGFTKQPLYLFDDGEGLQEVFNEIVGYLPSDVDLGAYNQHHKASKMLWDIAHNNHLVSVMNQIFGPDIIITNVQLFTKNKNKQFSNKTLVPLHQDLSFYNHDPKKLTSAWIAFNDVTLDNSPVQFVPGSHLNGEIAHNEVDIETVTNSLFKGLDDDKFREKLQPVLMKAGQFTLHDGWTIHGSSAGISKRTGLQVQFTTPDVKLSSIPRPGTSASTEVEASVASGVDNYKFNRQLRLPPQGEVEPLGPRNASSKQYLQAWLGLKEGQK
jgi:hypothetical protein